MTAASLSPHERRDRADRIAQTEALFEERRTSTDRRDVEERVIQLNMPVANSIARRYDNRGFAADDVTQIAYLGLVKAVQGFDPDRGIDFLGFAVPTIRGEVRRMFRDAGWAVRPPRSVQELQPRIIQAWDRLTQEFGRTPTEAEIADDLEETPDAVRRARAARGCFRLDSLEPSDPDGAALDHNGSLGITEHGFASTEARVLLDPLIAALDDRERLILDLWLHEGATQAEIGRRVGVSQVHVSRLLAAMLRRMREQLEGPPSGAAA